MSTLSPRSARSIWSAVPYAPGGWARGAGSGLVAGLFACLAALATACGAAPGEVRYLDDAVPLDFGPGYVADGPVGDAWLAWFEGRADAADAQFGALQDQGGALSLFGQAELALSRGAFSTALSRHVDLVARYPGHPLATIAVIRLERLLYMANEPAEVEPAFTTHWQKLSLESRVTLARVAADYADHRAIHDGAPRPDRTPWGSLAHWRWSGPYSPFPNAGYAGAYPPEQGGELEAQARWEGRAIARHEGTYHGRVSPAWKGPGVYYLETFLEVAAPTEAVLALDTQASAEVWLDGAHALGRSTLAGYPTERLARLVQLEAGRHRVLVKYGAASRDDGFELQVVPTRGEPAFGLVASQPGPLAGASLGPLLHLQGGLPDDLTELAAEPFYLWLAAILAEATGDYARGRLAVQLAMPVVPEFSGMRLIDAELLSKDPALDRGIGVGLAIDGFRKAVELDPRAGFAHMLLGYMLDQEDQHESALEHLDALVALEPDEFRAHYGRYQALDALGWQKPAQAAMREAASLRPASCTLAADVIALDVAENRYPTPASVDPGVLLCPAVQAALVRYYHLPRGDLDAAIGVYEALAARDPADATYLLRLADLASQRADLDGAQALYARAAALEQRGAHAFAAQRVDLLLAAGRTAEAEQLLAAALIEDPSNLELHELLRRFDRSRILGDLRVDGLAVVTEYLNDEREYTQSAFYLLDYAAFRYFPDGSGLSVTHSITRVLNKDATNRMGEVFVPAGAIVTELRTIKSDGRTTIEPEVIPNKEKTSMPNLEVGDFIELEYIAATPPRIDGTGAFVVPRWYFQIFEAPLMYSELVVEVPVGTPLQFDVRGPVPEPTVTERGAFTRYRYLMREMLDPRPEPGAPGILEIVPSVRMASGLDGEYLRQSVRDNILPTTVPSAYLQEALELGRAGATDPAEVARRLFKFVKAEIAEESQSYFGSPASWVWTSRAGSRFSLLKALLDLAEVPNEVVLVKPFGTPELEPAVPDLTAYSEVLLMVDVGGDRPVWLNPTMTHAKFDYASPELQGQPGLSLGPVPQRVTVDRFDPEIDRQRLTFELELDAAGDVTGKGSEASDGVAGTGVRNFITRYRNDPDEVRTRLAEYLVPYFGDVRVLEFEFEGADAEGPVAIVYELEAAGFARVVEGGISLQTTSFGDALVDRYASLPQRTQELVIGVPVRTELDIVLTVPDGMTLEARDEELQLETPFGTFVRRQEVGSGELRIFERLDVPLQRITPEAYPAFQEFARQVDDAQAIRLVAVRR